MADTAVETPTPVTPVKEKPSKKTKGAAAGVKKAVKKPTHPPTSEMVTKAISDLKEKGGSSLQAIKKYIAANYKVDADRVAPFVRKYLKAAVEKGALVRTKGKGKGATGSFKLEAKNKPAAAKKETAPKAKKTGVKAGRVEKKKPAAKKAAAAPKKAKAAAAKKPKAAAAPKKAAAAAKPKKTPTKAKKTAKPPTKKPKTPMAKKAATGGTRGRPAGKKTAAKK